MLGLLAAPAAQAGVPQANAQVWGEVDLTVPVAPNVSATALAVDRNGEGLPNPTLAGGGLTLDARAGHWTFTLGDLGVAARSAVSGKTVDVDVPLGAVAYGWSLAGLNFDDRSRIERLDGLPGDPWRYRNRLQVSHPLEGLGPIGAVFASDEAFYDFSRQKWDRNRAQVGFSVHVARRQRLDIYYLRQDDRYARPGTLHALGLAYRVVLR
jgi:hypothetical protein